MLRSLVLEILDSIHELDVFEKVFHSFVSHLFSKNLVIDWNMWLKYVTQMPFIALIWFD